MLTTLNIYWLYCWTQHFDLDMNMIEVLLYACIFDVVINIYKFIGPNKINQTPLINIFYAQFDNVRMLYHIVDLSCRCTILHRF